MRVLRTLYHSTIYMVLCVYQEQKWTRAPKSCPIMGDDRAFKCPHKIISVSYSLIVIFRFNWVLQSKFNKIKHKINQKTIFLAVNKVEMIKKVLRYVIKWGQKITWYLGVYQNPCISAPETVYISVVHYSVYQRLCTSAWSSTVCTRDNVHQRGSEQCVPEIMYISLVQYSVYQR